MQPQQNDNYWQPSAEHTAPVSPPEAADQIDQDADYALEPLSWQASEAIHYEKSILWVLGLLGGVVILLVLDFLLVRSWTFGALIIVMALSALVIGRRVPRTVTYTLSEQGVSIDGKLFHFHNFRGFGIVPDGAFYSVRLIPNKRFLPTVSIIFSDEQAEEIVDIFGRALPMETIEKDPIEKLTDKLRF